MMSRSLVLGHFALAFSVLALAATGLTAQTARLQLAHASPDSSVRSIDLKVVDASGDTLVTFGDMNWAQATSFFDVPTGETIQLLIMDDSGQDVLYASEAEFAAGQNYFGALIGSMDGAAEGGGSLQIKLRSDVRLESTSADRSVAQFFLLHGAPGADPVRLRVNGATFGDNQLVQFAGVTGYGNIPSGSVDLSLEGPSGVVLNATTDLSELAGKAGAFVLGRVPARLDNEEPFALLAFLPDGQVLDGGTGDPRSPPPVRYQIIHASPDPENETILLNISPVSGGGFKTTEPRDDDVAIDYRRSTSRYSSSGTYSFSTTTRAAMAKAGNAAASPIGQVTFESGNEYTVTLTGVENPNDYPRNPRGQSTAFKLRVDERRTGQTIAPGFVDVTIVNAVPDAPPLGVVLLGQRRDSTLAEPVQYGDYHHVGRLPIGQKRFALTAGESRPTPLFSFSIDLTPFDGQSVVIPISGFLNARAGFLESRLGVGTALGRDDKAVEGSPEVIVAVINASSSRAVRDSLQVIFELQDESPEKTTGDLDDDVAVDRGGRSYGSLSPGSYSISAFGSDLVAAAKTAQDVIGRIDEFIVDAGKRYSVAVLDSAGTATDVALRTDDRALAVVRNPTQIAFQFLNTLLADSLGNLTVLVTAGNDTLFRQANLSYGAFSDPTSLPYRSDMQISIFDASDSLLVNLANVANESGLGRGFLVSIQQDPDGNIDAPGIDNSVNTAFASEDPAVPGRLTLHGNYPNPFNPTTHVVLDIPEAGEVGLDVFDITGRKVMTITPEWRAAGRATVRVDAGRLPSGVYLYRIYAETPGRARFEAVDRMVLLR